ncbi:methyltransferase type 11 [Saccharomonospora sp. CUA-673]|uniref:class I SAM-dependent methyltransferase n=1 Tax=Saccharomonospora sp. CUA-673 TaxID=1904969 RepID=UPI000962E000|nr:class I SAM-dependent methyltransferase [Saccharomonospora sp. CUA-673]OLT47848.1 methyltransferase type 11 [Saccharomonospora sp. CUA-673]
MSRFSRKTEVYPSPNIWYHADTYELENRVHDVDGAIWRELERRAPWAGRDVVDLGCGDGFHLPRMAAAARSVLGVEPHPPLVGRAQRRVDGLANVTVKRGRAQRIPAADGSVDVVHARTAYFFGPGCEPGLREVDRVLRPGGTLVIVDLDTRHAPYGEWMLADLPQYDPDAVDAFFAAQGFECRRVETRWVFPDERAVEAVLGIEFSPRVARRAAAETLAAAGGARGVELAVGYRVLTRRKPTGLIVRPSVEGIGSAARSSKDSAGSAGIATTG